MEIDEFKPFRLVGGTSLSLRYGHRMSDDIDLFTDAEYGSLDFRRLQEILRREFPYCQGDCGDIVGFGTSYMVGNSKDDFVKLDLFYTDPFIRPMEQRDKIRMASVDDIVAMKMEVISRGGRKKDFGICICYAIIIARSKCSLCMRSVIHMERQRKSV